MQGARASSPEEARTEMRHRRPTEPVLVRSDSRSGPRRDPRSGPAPHWLPPQFTPTPDEAARTEQLVKELLGSEDAVPATPAPLLVRVALGTLCGVLLLGSAVAGGSITARFSTDVEAHEAAPHGELAFRPDVLRGKRDGGMQQVAVRPPAPPGEPLSDVNPAAGTPRAAVQAVRAFYRGLESDPGAAVARLAPGVLLSPRNEVARAWSEAATVRPVRVHALSAHVVLSEVEVGYADGARVVLRHRITVTGDRKPLIVRAELLSAQHFPR